jgi:hypothetical protein
VIYSEPGSLRAKPHRLASQPRRKPGQQIEEAIVESNHNSAWITEESVERQPGNTLRRKSAAQLSDHGCARHFALCSNGRAASDRVDRHRGTRSQAWPPCDRRMLCGWQPRRPTHGEGVRSRGARRRSGCWPGKDEAPIWAVSSLTISKGDQGGHDAVPNSRIAVRLTRSLTH